MNGPSSLEQESAEAHGAPAPLSGALAPLTELAYNLWWTWDPRGWAVFERIDPGLWGASRHNPVKMLTGAGAQRLARLAEDKGFVAQVREARDAMWDELRAPAWYERGAPRPDESKRRFQAAYFCAEYGLAECMQTYSGGLGLLAGDHLKSASCLGLPLVGVGLLYSHGYFQQALDDDGRQEELYPPLKPAQQPVRRVLDGGGQQRRISVTMAGREVQAAIWRIDVGRVALYLLDTDMPGNAPEDRAITRNLYLGDQETRIRQEVVLGIGGVRALEAVGEQATVFHMNEGHSAFLALERTRRAWEAAGGAVTFDQAREATAAGHIFTTHTPVPAGIDRFAPSLVAKYFAGYTEQLGLDMEGFLALGRENVADRSESFSMAVLAIRMSRWCNGVSRLHGKVSRGMWRNIWPGTPEDDVPIGHVTNGVLTPGWVGPQVRALMAETMGENWHAWPAEAGARAWDRVLAIPDERVWEARQAARRDLVEWCRAEARERLFPTPPEPAAVLAGSARDVLDPGVLTIGFARRFAAYKRGTLLLRDPERLVALLRSSTPVQVLISGKAHPGDTGGKRLINEIVRFARARGVQDRLLFIEDYDIEVARRLVRGCDVWLNNPIRGLEASGTSGMKAAANGGVNVSTLDGWWDEAFAPDLGYHIESVGTFDHDLPNDQREQFESDALYRMLEHSIVPEFYERDQRGVPAAWVARMKRCIRALGPRFGTHRMVAEYAERYYFPAHNAYARLADQKLAQARALSDHIDRYRKFWPRVRVIDVHSEPSHGRTVYDVAAVVELDALGPDEVAVQLRHGQLDSHGELVQGQNLAMAHEKDLTGGAHRFTARFAPARSARAAWVVRVLPGDPSLVTPFIPALITSSTLQRAEAHMHEAG